MGRVCEAPGKKGKYNPEKMPRNRRGLDSSAKHESRIKQLARKRKGGKEFGRVVPLEKRNFVIQSKRADWERGKGDPLIR